MAGGATMPASFQYWLPMLQVELPRIVRNTVEPIALMTYYHTMKQSAIPLILI
ncbi:hypothetical protein RvY_08425 [Ramazzottius varieornatus]|uniref:Uncharacterized protein n=1 Tax=Ramazzottius varieornatus TaxID=947166 RepID=A0A1D1V5Q5_RAMVA|nr:hypothetical protein RvY_08425 [Ramazzottius varieornatus]